jgi:hypothetical protein
MWLYAIAGGLIVVGIVGGILGGGIFTIVLLPVGVIVGASAVAYAMWGRASQGAAGGSTDAAHGSERPLPHHTPADSGRAPSSPERLADARRTHQ